MPNEINVADRLTVLTELGYERMSGGDTGVDVFRSRTNPEDRLVMDLGRGTIPLEDFRGNLDRNGVDAAVLNAAFEQLWPAD